METPFSSLSFFLLHFELCLPDGCAIMRYLCTNLAPICRFTITNSSVIPIVYEPNRRLAETTLDQAQHMHQRLTPGQSKIRGLSSLTALITGKWDRA